MEKKTTEFHLRSCCSPHDCICDWMEPGNTVGIYFLNKDGSIKDIKKVKK